MDRRNFLQISAAVLAAQGHLPLLAANKRKNSRKKTKSRAAYTSSSNIYTDPAAIEPITGFLPKFTPVDKAAMGGDFTAKYMLIVCVGASVRSNNAHRGSIEVVCSDRICKTIEARNARSKNIVKAEINCRGKFNTVSSWTLNSSVEGMPGLNFVEKGTSDGKTMVVKSRSWTQKHTTANPLIARWALPGLLSSGRIRSAPLTFDMLDDSTLRRNQTLSYSGKIDIPLADTTVRLDSYAQVGSGIVPTHYLVDNRGRVQLITMSNVNWALSSLGKTTKR